jgi:hypothetical protein
MHERRAFALLPATCAIPERLRGVELPQHAPSGGRPPGGGAPPAHFSTGDLLDRSCAALFRGVGQRALPELVIAPILVDALPVADMRVVLIILGHLVFLVGAYV